jgi:hypothetical protein
MGGRRPFAVSDIPLHLIDIYFANGLAIFVCILIWSIHMNIHDMFRDHLKKVVGEGASILRIRLTLSRVSLCSSFTINIISNRDKMVVWKSIFCRGAISPAKIDPKEQLILHRDFCPHRIVPKQGLPPQGHWSASSRQ